MKNYFFNNPYMYLIIKGNELPVFINKDSLIIPIFLEYNHAKNFNDKFLINQDAQIITVSVSKGMNFIENIITKNHFLPQIGIYSDSLVCYDSKEFLSDYDEYKQSFNEILNGIIKSKSSIESESIVMMLTNSPFYILTTSKVLNEDECGCKAFMDNNGRLLGLQFTKGTNCVNFFEDKESIVLFTDKEEFEKYKLKYKDKNVDIKKYLSIENLIDDINEKELDINIITINPCSMNCKVNLINLLEYSIETL